MGTAAVHLIPTAFPLALPPDDHLAEPINADPMGDATLPSFADEWNALLNDPTALDNLGRLLDTSNTNTTNGGPNARMDDTATQTVLPAAQNPFDHSHLTFPLNWQPSSVAYSLPGITEPVPQLPINASIRPCPPAFDPSMPYVLVPTNILPIESSSLLSSSSLSSSVSTSPFDQLHNYSRINGSNGYEHSPFGTNFFPSSFTQRQSFPQSSGSSGSRSTSSQADQLLLHRQRLKQQQQQAGINPFGTPLGNPLLANSPINPFSPNFQFPQQQQQHGNPYNKPLHPSPLNSPQDFHTGAFPQAHTYSPLSQQPLFSPALTNQIDINPFDKFLAQLQLSEVQSPNPPDSKSRYRPSRLSITENKSAATGLSPSYIEEPPSKGDTNETGESIVPTPKASGKRKRLRSRSNSADRRFPLDPLDKEQEERPDSPLKGIVDEDKVERSTTPKPRPIQEFLGPGERTPSPPPLLTGPPYIPPDDSPGTADKLERYRGRIKVRGGSLIGLGLGFSPKSEETSLGCPCDPSGIRGKKCWRKSSRTSSDLEDLPHETRDDIEMDGESSPHGSNSTTVAGMKRKSSPTGKGKEREVLPRIGGSNLEYPAGQPLSATSQPHKRKKPRIALSCAQCTKRKQKCNRQIPCQHCTSRRIPEQCTPYIPGQPLPESTKAPPLPRGNRKPKKNSISIEAKIEPSTPGASSNTGAGNSIQQDKSADESSSNSSGPEDDSHMSGRGSFSRPVFTPASSHMSPFADHVSGQGSPFTAGDGSTQARSPFVPFSKKPEDLPRQIRSVPDIVPIISPRPANNLASVPMTRQSSSGDADPSSGDIKPMMEPFSRSVSAGETSVDAAKWFATDGTVPGVETLRGDAKIALNTQDCGTPSENLRLLIENCGVSPDKLLELVKELPPHPFASRLVDSFFKQINHVRYPIHEAGFRAAFEDMYRKKEEGGPAANNVRSLPLIFIVLATSVRLAEWAGDDRERKITSLKMYWFSRRSILIATAIQPDSLELVVTRLLSALYLVLMHDRRLTECWSQLGASLRTAQAIGLHRDGTKFGLDPVQTEYRRRIWSFLYHADRNYSLILGRPPSIIDAYCDTKEPMNVEFAKVTARQKLVPKPLSEPTSSTFIILRRRFAKIVGDITYLFNKLHEHAKIEEVEQLDKDLRNFIQDLPPHFRMENADKSLDYHPDHSYIPIHRFYLLTEILFIIITLHRPWLLRKLKSDKILLSRRACFDAAKMDFRIRQAFRADHPGVHNAYVGGQFREFNAGMIAGIYAIMHPRGDDADEMRLILSTFLQQRSLAKVQDSTSRREISIIQTLHRKACLALDPRKASNTSDAALLLSLREGENMRQADPAVKIEPASLAFGDTLFPPNLDVNLPGDGTVRPNALSRITTTAPFQPLSHAASSKRKHRASASAGSAMTTADHKSPASSASHEDDQPQRLLDKWLTLHSSFSVGHVNDNDFGMPNLPTWSQGMDFGFQPRNPLATNPAPTLGLNMDTSNWASILSPNGTRLGSTVSAQDPILSDQLPAYQEPQRDTFHGISDRMAGMQYAPMSGFDNMGMQMELVQDPSDDVYWENLIDAIQAQERDNNQHGHMGPAFDIVN